LGASPETLSAATQGEVIPFKTRLDAKSVLAALRGEDTTDATADG
jgi:hypothetical protein